jgi:hypothetical protein
MKRSPGDRMLLACGSNLSSCSLLSCDLPLKYDACYFSDLLFTAEKQPPLATVAAQLMSRFIP